MTFLAPAALSALALCAVPILLHLLHRRRARVVEWAPMHFLALAVQTSRRRVRLEELLLLAVRCAAVALVALALARPSVEGALAGHLAGGASKSVVVVLDDTLSTGYRTGGASAFDRARAAVAGLADRAAGGDAWTVLLASAPPRPLARELHPAGADLGALLAPLAPTDVAAPWDVVLAHAADACERAAHPARELVLVTDLRAAGWSAAVGPVCERLAAAGARCVVVDAGADATADVAVLALEAEPVAAVVGVPLRLDATFGNAGPAPVGPASATVRGGGASAHVDVPALGPGERARVSVHVTPAAAGPTAYELALDADDPLPATDRRAVVLDVRERLDLLLVDGEPGAAPFESETDFLRAAFTVGDVPWRVYVQTDAEWLAAPPPTVDLCVLANVAEVPAAHARALEARVAAGMGLVLFPGERVEPEAFDLQLFRAGSGLAPGAWVAVAEEPRRGLAVEAWEDSPLAPLAELLPGALTELAARRVLEVGVPDGDSSRVLARWDGARGLPAVLERTFGRGRVLLFTVTADRAWSDWPLEPSFVLALREAARRTADRGRAGLVATAGAPVPLDPRGAEVAGPALTDEGGATAGRPAERAGALVFEDVVRAGVLRASFTAAGEARIEHPVAVQFDARECDLARVPQAQLTEWTAPLAPRVVGVDDVARLDELSADGGRELWRRLAAAALVLLGVESLFALWVGRRG